MTASDDFAAFLRDQLAPLGRITMRRMFGKTGVFCEGVMLAMVTENTLYVRVDDRNRATFEEAATSPPLNYRKQGSTIDLSFWRVPDRLLDEPDELVIWARAALAAAHRVAAKRNVRGDLPLDLQGTPHPEPRLGAPRRGASRRIRGNRQV